jgi:SAM-dependent methyltransferase
MSDAAPSPTFRDPAGSLRLEGDHAIRTLHTASQEAALVFVTSSFAKRLEARGDMVSSTVETQGEETRLLHPRLAIPTYPWEWTPSQWHAAADLTLALGEEAVDEGWVLKDATPLNILFNGPKPVLVDVLSFDPRDPQSSIWLAYGQYVRTFLLPLLVHKLLHWPLELTLFRRDGYEPAEIVDALSLRQKFSPSVLWSVTLPAWIDRRKSSGVSQPTERKFEAGAAAHILKRTMASLRKRTHASLPQSVASEWSDYTAVLTHYTAEQSADKLAWVRAVIAETKPSRVLDIGANTGEFSSLAAESGAEVVALERDAAAADRLYKRSVAKKLPILTIHADLARPTPAVGWQNEEQSSLLQRLTGKFDLVLMLAVIHHLILMEQIPISAIMDLAHRLTRRYLILEWVPVTDPMFQSLMRGRDALYGALQEADFLHACTGRFSVLRRHVLGNGRILFFLESV